MRILHINPNLFGGGIEAMICNLANKMAEKWDTTVCSIYEPKESDVFWYKLQPAVKKYTIGKRKLGFSLKEIWKVYRYIARGKFDVVYLHCHIQYHVLAILLLHNKVRFFYTVHSDAFMENIGWAKRLFLLRQFFFKHRWVTPITISNASQESFTKLFGCSSELIYNGVPRPLIPDTAPIEVSKLRTSKDTVIFMHPGRISEEKNQVVLCKVINRLLEDGHDVALLIAGTVSSPVVYDELSVYFSDRIVYLGLRGDVPALLAYSDAFCLPSIWEGLPVTLLEALSVGCVPICSPVGGIVNVITSGDNGLLAASSSEEDYYQAMRRFVNMSKEERCAMRHNCIESFTPYDIANTAKEYIALV